MADAFESHSPGLSSPCTFGEAITPNDGADLANVSKEIFFGGAGTVKVTWLNGQEKTLTVVAGDLRAWRVKRIWATGTTATGIEVFS